MTSGQKKTKHGAQAQDPQQEAAAVRVGRPRQARDSLREKGQVQKQEGQGIQEVANPRQTAQAAKRKLINGQWHRICTGPAHDQPTWLPETDKYFYRYSSGPREGRIIARCRLCKMWGKVKDPGSEHGWIPIAKARPYFIEAANRIGLMELARRSGLSPEMISRTITGKGKFTQKASLRKVMLELVSIKRKGEHSINGYASWRVVKRANGYQETCSGCNGSLGNYTEGCQVCWERRRGRERRLTEE